MYEQSYEFTFETAHHLGANVPEMPDHPYSRVHGHSIHCRVTLQAAALGGEGWITDFAILKAACGEIYDLLDHRFLNTVPGLEDTPTMERLAAFIAEKLHPALPALHAVTLSRPSLKEEVRYIV